MISFRIRPPASDDWDTASFSGDHEDLLAHSFARHMLAAGWEVLAGVDAGEEELLDEGWIDA